MQRVIFVSPHSDLYGAERSLISIMLYARKVGYRPVLILKKSGPIESVLKEKKIEYLIVPFRQCVNTCGVHDFTRGLKDYIRDRQTLSHFINQNKELCAEAVLVHTNSIITYFGVMLSQALRVPHIQHIREFGREDFGMEFNFNDKLTAKIINKSSRIVCISDAVFETYKKLFDVSKMVRIYNGVPHSALTQKKRHQSDSVNIILVGRLSSEKGQREAIAACKILMEKGISNFELHLYGNGVDEEDLKRYVFDNGMEKNIFFKGYSTDINYSDYDIALMVSRAEAFGRVTVEYMLNGLPVVGTASGGTTEIVVDKETGLLSKPGDLGQLATNIEQLILDARRREKLGSNGKMRANELFTEEAYGRNIMSLYAEVLDIHEEGKDI